MNLKEFLKKELVITDNEAERIEEVVKKYKEMYGHHHHHEHNSNTSNDIFNMIEETKEECQNNNFDLNKIHCNGCPHRCSLDNPNCGRGQMLQKEFTKLKTSQVNL